MPKTRSLIVVLLIAVCAVVFSIGCVSQYVRSAKIYLQQNDPQNAKEELLKGSKVTPDDPELWYLLGKVYVELEDWDGMNEAFGNTQNLTDKFDTDILATKKESWRISFNKGVKPFNKEKYDKALENFEIALKIIPGDMETLKRIGQCYLQKEDEAKAEKYLKLALEKDAEKKDVGTRVNLLNMYWSQERWDDVIDYSYQILEIDSTRTDVIDKIALSYQQKNMDEEAIAAWAKVIAANPDNPDFHFNKSMLYIRMEKLEEAVEGFYKVLELNPEDEEAMKYLMSSLLNLQRWEDLVALLEPVLFPDGTVEVLESPKDDVDSWKVLNAAYMNVGQKENALTTVKIIDKLEAE